MSKRKSNYELANKANENRGGYRKSHGTFDKKFLSRQGHELATKNPMSFPSNGAESEFLSQLTKQILRLNENENLHISRKLIAKSVRSMISELNLVKGYRLDATGSYCTKLHNNSSDVNFSIFIPNLKKEKDPRAAAIDILWTIKKKIRHTKNLVLYEDEIPCLCFTLRKVPIEITCVSDPALRLRHISASTKFSQQCRDFKPMVMIIKQFLKSRDLYDKRKGGLGGYGVQLIVQAFFLIYPLIFSDDSYCLGELLIHFLYFFGTVFDYSACGLSPGGQVSLPNSSRSYEGSTKYLFLKNNYGYGRDRRLCLLDQVDYTVDVAANFNDTAKLAHCFLSAYETLCDCAR